MRSDSEADCTTYVSARLTALHRAAYLLDGGDYNQPTRVTPQRTVERLPLPPGLLLPPDGPGAVATTISDDGRIITGATAAEHRRPLIWHC